MKHDNKAILQHLKEIEYIRVKGAIRQWLLGDIIGWNVSATSVMRKPYTIERLKETIEEEHLPLEVVDTPYYLNSFQVYLKEES